MDCASDGRVWERGQWWLNTHDKNNSSALLRSCLLSSYISVNANKKVTCCCQRSDGELRRNMISIKFRGEFPQLFNKHRTAVWKVFRTRITINSNYAFDSFSSLSPSLKCLRRKKKTLWDLSTSSWATERRKGKRAPFICCIFRVKGPRLDSSHLGGRRTWSNWALIILNRFSTIFSAFSSPSIPSVV